LHYGKEKIIKMLNEALGQELVSDIVFKWVQIQGDLNKLKAAHQRRF
jgi:bacterioferritin (cytochrome b1)